MKNNSNLVQQSLAYKSIEKEKIQSHKANKKITNEIHCSITVQKLFTQKTIYSQKEKKKKKQDSQANKVNLKSKVV